MRLPTYDLTRSRLTQGRLKSVHWWSPQAAPLQHEKLSSGSRSMLPWPASRSMQRTWRYVHAYWY